MNFYLDIISVSATAHSIKQRLEVNALNKIPLRQGKRLPQRGKCIKLPDKVIKTHGTYFTSPSDSPANTAGLVTTTLPRCHPLHTSQTASRVTQYMCLQTPHPPCHHQKARPAFEHAPYDLSPDGRDRRSVNPDQR